MWKTKDNKQFKQINMEKVMKNKTGERKKENKQKIKLKKYTNKYTQK